MLDLRYIREHPDEVRAALAKLHTEAPLDEVLALDARHRALLAEVEELRAARNAGSKEVSKLRDPAERNRRIAEMRALGDRIAALEGELNEVRARLDAALLEMPNLPDPDVPVGRDESENVVLRHWLPGVEASGLGSTLLGPLKVEEWNQLIQAGWQPLFESTDIRIGDRGGIDLLRTFDDAIDQQLFVVETGCRQLPARAQRDRVQSGKVGQNLVVNQRHVEPPACADITSMHIRAPNNPGLAERVASGRPLRR